MRIAALIEAPLLLDGARYANTNAAAYLAHTYRALRQAQPARLAHIECVETALDGQRLGEPPGTTGHVSSGKFRDPQGRFKNFCVQAA